ncbi:adenosylcobinamide amidohydrolase [Parasulfitobacter algicola]
MQVTLNRPWLEARFDTPLRVLSWSINKPGFTKASRILWREVRNADLPADLDVDQWLDDELRRTDQADAVVLLTSREVTAYVLKQATCADIMAVCLATVGLSNAERIGYRVPRNSQDWGTINVAVSVDIGLTKAAQIEALTIAAQARTAAVMNAGVKLPTGRATGTGTDCIAMAAPKGEQRYAGLHTEIGEAIGRAVYDAVAEGAQDWIKSRD